MAPAGPVRAQPDRRYDQSPTPARVSGVYAVDEPRIGHEQEAERAHRAAGAAARQPTRAWRPSVPALHAVLQSPGQPFARARRLPRAGAAALRPISLRAPVIEVEELEGRDAAYVALLELAIADEEWDQDELTQVYAPVRQRASSRPKAPREALDRMLDELVAVTIADDWEDDPVTHRYPLARSQDLATVSALRPLAHGVGAVASCTPASPPLAARRAGGWRPVAPLPASWRR